MKAFTELYTALDETTKTNLKVSAIVHYLKQASDSDAAWAVFFLTGGKIKQLLQAPKLAAWASDEAKLPFWMFAECYNAVGDLAETIALLLPFNDQVSERSLTSWVEQTLLPLRGMPEVTQRAVITESWPQMSDKQRFVWNKLITGAFRVGVSHQLVVRALAQCSGLEPSVIAHRLMGTWSPTAEFYRTLIKPDSCDTDVSRPYPFYLAYPFDGEPTALGKINDWQVEWKWDGIRAQIVRRKGQTFIWSRGEELVTDRYPELIEAAVLLPDGTVIDGEILPWKEADVLPFSQLQMRIGRKAVSRKLITEVPVILMAYDLLEWAGEDIRPLSLQQRRAQLERLLRGIDCSMPPPGYMQLNLLLEAEIPTCQRLSTRLRLSPTLEPSSWQELDALKGTARNLNVEGVMLKRLSSPYRVGRQRGDWWKWKVSPHTVDAVLIYAQPGSGKRASLYTDYTFGVWSNGKLVPIAKAYSGLTDDEIRRVDQFVRQNTLGKHGPVRMVKPELVFEIAFEGIQLSARHKSGVAVRFPRINRWRLDKQVAEADTLEQLQALLPASS